MRSLHRTLRTPRGHNSVSRIIAALCSPALVVGCTETVGTSEAEVSKSESALTGIEGTMEYAIDAPWRIEPVKAADGSFSYGSIPIQLSIHDADQVDLDFPGSLGRFCELSVKEEMPTGVRRRSYALRNLEEIELSGRWTSPTASAPGHSVCRPAESSNQCEELRVISGRAEWHAVAWYSPGILTPGADIPLTLEAKVTRDGNACDSTNPDHFFTFRNYATVHLAEEPLPRFGDGWLYGDLHYHSQGTDNEGESAYNYRGVIRALGAMGVDFAVAAEHTSNAHQIIDVDVDWDYSPGDFGPGATGTLGALRDMSPNRYRFLRNQLHNEDNGVNLSTAMNGPGTSYPQSFRSSGVVPQVFLGGEVDAIPEVQQVPAEREDFVCQIWPHVCYEAVSDGFLLKDSQGMNEYDYGREHLIYIPKESTDPDALVAGNTGAYGGAQRRLNAAHNGQAAILPELESKAVAFVAHPLNSGDGGRGPGTIPWNDHMYNQVWRSPSVLGLQLWNGAARLSTEVASGFQEGQGDAEEFGFSFDGSVVDDEAEVCDGEPREGFETGLFELQPYYNLQNRSWGARSTSLEEKLHYGTYDWEKLLRNGLRTDLTNTLSWLPQGEPRRFFIAGGSDAHGDLNYRREGYMLYTTGINDNALAKVRNLIFLGDPELPRDSNEIPDDTQPVASKTSKAAFGQPLGTPTERPSQSQLVNALSEGQFTVTDGPALRIVIDRNRNGVIDGEDTPMGGIVELNGEATLPVIVQWSSTPEFGPIARAHLYMGVRSDAISVDGHARSYAPANQGPRNAATLPGATAVSSYTNNGRTYVRMEDNYWRDPTGHLTVNIPSPSYSGQQLIEIPIDAFEPHQSERADRMYIRAFAETSVKDPAGCADTTSAAARRKGACTQHYAFTNPIWAITPGSGQCVATNRSFDRDGDGKPDGCDPCPESSYNVCRAQPIATATQAVAVTAAAPKSTN